MGKLAGIILQVALLFGLAFFIGAVVVTTAPVLMAIIGAAVVVLPVIALMYVIISVLIRV